MKVPAALLILTWCAAAQPTKVPEIPLRTMGDPAPDVFEMPASGDLPKRFTVVNRPSIYVFLPPKEKATGVAVVVAPGGGHNQLVIDKEGWEMAEWFNRHGIAAFVLKYRLARAVNSKYTVQGDALDDAKRALRMVRCRAAEWGVNPARVGFLGFSAGGELAALMETRFDAGDAKAEDPVERMSSRPDFTMLIYPGWRADTVITVPKDAPPAFLVCADDDPSHVVLTAQLYLDLEKQGVSSEMHIYADGKHGFGLRAPASMPVSGWTERMKEWMVDRGILAGLGRWLCDEFGVMALQDDLMKMLDRRYDEIEGGDVRAIPGMEIEWYFRNLRFPIDIGAIKLRRGAPFLEAWCN